MSVGWTCPGANHQPDCIGHNGKDGKHPTPCRTQGEPRSTKTAINALKREKRKLQDGGEIE